MNMLDRRRFLCLTGATALFVDHTPWVRGLKVYTDMLASKGYHVGYTGKGCGPTDWNAAGRKTNPAGAAFNRHIHKSGSKGISNIDYARKFQECL